MGIDVKWEIFNLQTPYAWGEELGAVGDPKGVLSALLHRSQGRQWQLVQHIDPYGDTVFNQLQIPTLMDELSALEEFAHSDEERQFLKVVLELIERSKNDIHTCVRFVGD
jgi:hypothetical protein